MPKPVTNIEPFSCDCKDLDSSWLIAWGSGSEGYDHAKIGVHKDKECAMDEARWLAVIVMNERKLGAHCNVERCDCNGDPLPGGLYKQLNDSAKKMLHPGGPLTDKHGAFILECHTTVEGAIHG